jgi:hypothetical protein
LPLGIYAQASCYSGLMVTKLNPDHTHFVVKITELSLFFVGNA